MAIPSFQQFMLPVLQTLKEGAALYRAQRCHHHHIPCLNRSPRICEQLIDSQSLINEQHLGELMMCLDVGLSSESIYNTKILDSDYFQDEVISPF